MKAQKNNNLLRNQKGFTLIEIIAVLIILGILAAVAIPKYMALQDDARNSAAKGQIAEVKGRLSQSLAKYMLANNGTRPTSGTALITAANSYSADSCPTGATVEGEFTFSCANVAVVAPLVGGVRITAKLTVGGTDVVTSATTSPFDFMF